MLKLIIVDDEEIICESMKSMIDWSFLGMDVIATCSNGIDAMDVIVDEHPDIVITDIKMPVMDGIDLLKHAKQINPEIEFIFITGFAEFEYARSAMKYGVQHYLVKPCSEKDIIEAVSAVAKHCLLTKDSSQNTPFANPETLMQNLLVSRFFGHETLSGVHRMRKQSLLLQPALQEAHRENSLCLCQRAADLTRFSQQKMRRSVSRFN